MQGRTVVGAVLAPLGALASVLDLLALRAESDGRPPSALSLVLLGLAVAAVLFPLARRAAGPVVLAVTVAGVQVVGHLALLAATTGQVGHGGAVGLVCCPGTTSSAASDGRLAFLTGPAGVGLLVVQLLVAAAVGVGLALARRVAAEGLAALVPPGLRVFVLAVVRVAMPLVRVVRAPEPRCPLRSVLLVRTAPRRGPPRVLAPAT